MVKKVTLIILAVFLGTATLAKATNSNLQGEPVIILALISNDSNNRSSESISASIDGYMLTISIDDKVGAANIIVTNMNGAYIDHDNLIQTPDTSTFLIEDAGFYRVTITLSNGRVYYGNFTVAE